MEALRKRFENYPIPAADKIEALRKRSENYPLKKAAQMSRHEKLDAQEQQADGDTASDAERMERSVSTSSSATRSHSPRPASPQPTPVLRPSSKYRPFNFAQDATPMMSFAPRPSTQDPGQFMPSQGKDGWSVPWVRAVWRDGDGQRYWGMLMRRYADGTGDVVFKDGIEQERAEVGSILGRGPSPLKLSPCRPPPLARPPSFTMVKVPSCVSVSGALRPADF